jgi:hypothetical protein
MTTCVFTPADETGQGMPRINLVHPHKLALPDAITLVQQMQTGVRSAEAIVTAHLERLKALHPTLNAATQVFRERVCFPNTRNL